jgi:hypothetical protein
MGLQFGHKKITKPLSLSQSLNLNPWYWVGQMDAQEKAENV